ncbi:MAG: GspH/FimT family pseudopilin [Halieaceae bacterium]
MFTAVQQKLQSPRAQLPQIGRRSPVMRGYTLLELLVTMAIIAIIASLSGPSFMDMISRNRQSSALGSMFTMLSTARSEAVNLQTTVSACSSSDQTTCNTDNWESGWLVFVDDGTGTGGVANDGNVNGTEQMIRVGQAAGGSLTIRSRNFTDAGAVSFDDDGMSSDRGTLVLCSDGDASRSSAVILNFSGQARLAGDDDANGTLDEDDGTEISACP